jgi:hypothetical protein
MANAYIRGAAARRGKGNTTAYAASRGDGYVTFEAFSECGAVLVTVRRHSASLVNGAPN